MSTSVIPAAPGRARAIAAWDPRRPLAALWSPPGGPGRMLLAQPGSTFRFRIGSDGRGCSEWLGPGKPRIAFSGEPLTDLRRILSRPIAAAAGPTSGWMGFFAYDLGRVLEPAASGITRPADDRAWPLIELHRCDRAWVFDHTRREWPGGPPPFAGRPGRRSGNAPGFAIGDLRSATGRERFEASVARAIEYIRAGDVFQVNLAHRLSGAFAGSTRRLFLDLARRARPWHGAYLESSDPAGRRRALVSMSPELFLELDGRSRRVITRPMKGTRPGAADPRDLEASPKDRAELNMIIDLMRNDLGRVCRFGTVQVTHPRTIEPHGLSPAHLLTCSPAQSFTPSLWQATGTITGELREGLDVCDLLGAAFPPGSVTGAPKIRAMRIIDEVEPVARGPYCGCIGWIGDDGSASFSVAIRTAVVTGAPAAGALDRIDDGVLDYSVGAGIVADSDPGAEWRETLDKATVLGSCSGA